MTFQLINADLNKILADNIAEYEKATGKKLFPAHIENSILQVVSYREFLLREAINYAFLQNFPQFANGEALDMLGNAFNCQRKNGESDDDYRERVLLAPSSFTTCGTAGMYQTHALQVEGVKACYVESPTGGEVDIYILGENQTTAPELVEKVQIYVADDVRRTLCDHVTVKPAIQQQINIVAKLDVFADFNPTNTVNKAKQSLQEFLKTFNDKLGRDIVPIDIEKALKIEGVYNVHLVSPPLTQLTKKEFAKFNNINISLGDVIYEM